MKFNEYKGLDLAQIAADVLGEWDARDTFHKSITTREGHPAFVFYEGPPSANGMPGIHHVMARTIKDVFCRYKTQQGYLVHRKAGWDTHVHGIGRQFATAKEAIETFRAETGVIDQDLPAFVIAENGKPVGKMEDGDSVILFNFRGDRAQEISMAFDGDSSFDKFDRGEMPKVKYAGMLQYDGDLCIPKSFLVNPPEIRNTLTELLVANGVNEFACSETQKFGHVTYFWNGNRSEKFSEELETWVEVPSDVRSFDECPWMKATEITDLVVDAIKSGKYGFIRCNYPNGDMVGHTGNLLATEIAVESVDLCLARVKKACDEYGAILCVTADHGNADQMLEKNKKGKISVRTAHSLNPVPFIVYDKDERHELKDGHGFGLANVAPTVAGLLGIKPFDSWEESMLK